MATARALVKDLEAQHPGLELWLTEPHGDSVSTLSKIKLPKETRGAGTGSAVMAAIVEWADEHGYTIAASPSSDFGGSKARIRAWNKRFGFVDNKGRNKDYAISETMYRLPQEKKMPRKNPTMTGPSHKSYGKREGPWVRHEHSDKDAIYVNRDTGEEALVLFATKAAAKAPKQVDLFKLIAQPDTKLGMLLIQTTRTDVAHEVLFDEKADRARRYLARRSVHQKGGVKGDITSHPTLVEARLALRLLPDVAPKTTKKGIRKNPGGPAVFVGHFEAPADGKWLYLSDYADEDELEAAIRAVHPDKEELMISDYSDLPNVLGETPTAEDLYKLYLLVEEHGEDLVDALLDYHGGDIDDAFVTLEEGDYFTIDSWEDYAYQLVDEGVVDTKNYVDYEAIARDIEHDYTSRALRSGGYVVINE